MKKGKDHIGNLLFAVYGKKHPVEIEKDVLSFELLLPGDCPATRRSLRPLTAKLLAKLHHAIVNRDGSYFRHLAGIVERPKQRVPVTDQLRFFLLAECFENGGKPKRAYRIAELKDLAAVWMFGKVVNERHITRLAKELGIKLHAPGRPRKTGQ